MKFKNVLVELREWGLFFIGVGILSIVIWRGPAITSFLVFIGSLAIIGNAVIQNRFRWLKIEKEDDKRWEELHREILKRMVQKILNNLLEKARFLLVRDGIVVPVIAWFRNGAMIGIPATMVFSKHIEDDKGKNAWAAGVRAKKINADAVVLIMDCAFLMRSIYDNVDETETPLTYPRNMRTEAITISYTSPPEGKDGFAFAPYKGGGDSKEPVVFIPTPQELKMEQYESRLTDLIRAGYNHAKKD